MSVPSVEQLARQPGRLKLQRLSRSVGPFRLEADFELAPGERACLLARSGAGKTSLLRLIAGLDASEGGQIFLGDRDLTLLPPQKRRVGYVFQEAALFPSMNVLENAAFGLKAQGVGRREREIEARSWLDRVGLGNRYRSAVQELSGGERQRIALVRALSWRPEIILLDEPFSALDRELRGDLRSLVVSLHQAWPVPLILVTHDLEDAQAISTLRLKVDESGASNIRRVLREN